MTVVEEEHTVSAQAIQWRTVHRVVFPTHGDTDTLPLYIDTNTATRSSSSDSKSSNRQQSDVVTTAVAQRSDFIAGRRQLHLPAFGRVSLGTYFNAFPAAYWRAHTSVSKVRLSVTLDGAAHVIVYRSSARGTSNRVESVAFDKPATRTLELPLANFGDGGWYWFDVIAGATPVSLTEAHWAVPEPEGFTPGTATVAVTTFNRPDFCVAHLRTFADAPELEGVIDELLVVDQGTKKVRDEDGFDEAATRLGNRFRLVEQGNLGGSGGFARGMYETVTRDTSRYVLLLDDDVLIETEGILRAVHFADFTRKPTIVGGHMFNLYERSVMHTYGEEVNEYKFFWGPLETTEEAHDFAIGNLRSTSWLHRRADVDFNGWWMCLIPTSVIKEIGLALPVFIKWDDAEFGLRAKARGYRTVSMPGAAVWHMPWTDKDDTIDWQAYYHQRNRWVAALLYSPYERGGSLPWLSFQVDIKHLVSMQYSAAHLRLNALEDILRGPAHLHQTLGTKLPEIRALRASFPDSTTRKDVENFPPVKRAKPPRKGKKPHPPKNAVAGLISAATAALRQISPVRAEALKHPEAVVPAMDARWWRLSHVDSAIVSTADGASASWYKRDSKEFRELAARSASLHRQLVLNWDRLSQEYKDAHPHFTSIEEWKKTFDEYTVSDSQ